MQLNNISTHEIILITKVHRRLAGSARFELRIQVKTDVWTYKMFVRDGDSHSTWGYHVKCYNWVGTQDIILGMILGQGCQTYEQVWTPHILKQAQLGVPHSKIHVELARLITELNKCLRSRRWKPLYIPIEGIWSDVQTRVGTPHMKINALRLLFWGGDTAHNNCEVRLVGRWVVQAR